MTDQSQPIAPETAANILGLVSLSGFVTYELTARRRDGLIPMDAEAPGPFDAGQEPTQDLRDQWAMQVMVQDEADLFAVRTRGTTSSDDVYEVVVDMAAIYRKNEPFVLSNQHATDEFVRGIALMQLFPYLRQQVHDLTTRLGAPITLGLLMGLGVAPDEDALSE